MSSARVLLTKSFIDSHDRAIKTIAIALREAGMEAILVDYETPEQIVATAIDEDVDVGLDRLGAVVDHSVPEDREHLELFLERVARRMRPRTTTPHDDDVTMLAVRRME